MPSPSKTGMNRLQTLVVACEFSQTCTHLHVWKWVGGCFFLFLFCFAFLKRSDEIQPSPRYDSNAKHQRKMCTFEKYFLTSHTTRNGQVYHLMAVVMELIKGLSQHYDGKSRAAWLCGFRLARTVTGWTVTSKTPACVHHSSTR